MKLCSIAFVFAASSALALGGCTKKLIDMLPEPGEIGPKTEKPAPPKSTPSPAELSTTTTTAAAAPVALEAPMPDVLAGFDGNNKHIEAALKKHGIAKLDTQDMDMFNMSKPVVVKTTKAGSQTCYDVHASAGATKRGYTMCVEKGKIQKVTALGANGLLPPGS